MTEPPKAVDHPSRRLLVTLPGSYDDARTRYEALVPDYNPAAFRSATSWQDTLAIAEKHATHGFMMYAGLDITPMLAGSSSRGRATECLIGNHTIAETMYRHDPSVMLHAPLRTIYEDGTGAVRFAVDQPSLRFASYHHSGIAATGERLDALLAKVITLLGGDRPWPPVTSAAP